jgi:hypothetical protein
MCMRFLGMLRPAQKTKCSVICHAMGLLMIANGYKVLAKSDCRGVTNLGSQISASQHCSALANAHPEKHTAAPEFH